MKSLSALSLSVGALLVSAVSAGDWPETFVGTWTTKSNKTLTGPGFYNVSTDTLIEPARTGFSYSFTADGYYEEAYFRAIANPQDPTCPGGIMQWQHGSWTLNTNGSVTLTPIKVDGRQLLSEPCDSDYSTYTRYNQSELFETYEIYEDAYHKRMRMNLYAWDGTPMNPMYIWTKTPIMNPTTTIDATATATSSKKMKRSAPPPKKAKRGEQTPQRLLHKALNPDWWWWMGVSLTGLGGLMYFGPRRMGY